ncbi:asparagine synthase (glutamine-hydrolyzing) [Streptomyces profundus]|uniref:asparagine synthase (glutamine-hydrolyzing) n=1 Tax=Streptomyces profundus TaxID=2867410 RepID=UPI001D16FAE6|nr:asparagine synthase (glutamine-hydrolyzing) [Streptomyces sp. MA3_2.13]UED88010.1 asparagine synthase (glutamine-hydrolyzing) [Streptomyces sp. MA3_2.13]
MCGIWGAVGTERTGHGLSRATARDCVRLLRHRGPDGDGLWWTPDAVLGHTRLAVFDTGSRAAQPMASQDGRLRMVFNGEIFNHAEIRADLERLGHRFAGTGDTEVLLAAYQRWGLDCLDRLNGMFALAVLDRADGSLTLVRDRFGIKPLYHLQREGQLAFCSEPKGLLPLLPGPPTPDLTAMSAFLTLRHVPAPRTLFAELLQLPAGSWLRWRDGTVRTGQWWDLAARRTRPPRPWRRAAVLRRTVEEAVETWSRSDVPVSAYLSGGLDSGILTGELGRLGRCVGAYTAEYDVPGYSEAEGAAEVATALSLPLTVVGTEVAVSPEQLAAMVRVRDHPLGMHNEVALIHLAERVSSKARVVLCGEGADELFAGYGRLYRLPFEAGKRRLRDLPHLRRPPATGWRRQVRSRVFAQLVESYSYLPMDVKHGLLRDDVATRLDGDSELLRTLEREWDRPRRVGRHRRLTHFMVKVHLPGLLHVLDGTAMAAGVESRVPFLDHRLVEWAYRLPQRDKLRWHGPLAAARALTESPGHYSERRDTTKWLLRRAFGDRVPAAVLTRAKRPFPAPLDEWLARPEADEVARLVLDDGARLHDVLDAERLRRWWAARGDGHPSFGRQAWLLINLEVWLRVYCPQPESVPDGTTETEEVV